MAYVRRGIEQRKAEEQASIDKNNNMIERLLAEKATIENKIARYQELNRGHIEKLEKLNQTPAETAKTKDLLAALKAKGLSIEDALKLIEANKATE